MLKQNEENPKCVGQGQTRRLDGTIELQEYRVIDETGVQLTASKNLAFIRNYMRGYKGTFYVQQMRQHWSGQCHWEDLGDDY